MRVRCSKDELDSWRPDLTIGAEYAVLGIEANDYRIVADQGDPCLYPPSLFEVVDATRPSEWVSKTEDGVEYAYPPELNAVGFWEDWSDRDPDARRVFAHFLNRLLGRVA